MEYLVSRPCAFSLQKLVCFGTAFSLLALSGCSSVAPSKTTSGAGTGAVVGGLGGAVLGSNSSMGTTTGVLGGAAAGALVGGIVGMVQDARDRKEQDRLAQERAYSQDMAKKKAEEARLKAEIDEETAIAQGFRISEIELNDARKKHEDSSAHLKRLMDEKSLALAKKKELDETREKTLMNEAKIAQLEEELSRLKGEDISIPLNKPAADVGQRKNEAPRGTNPPAAVKPGI